MVKLAFIAVFVALAFAAAHVHVAAAAPGTPTPPSGFGYQFISTFCSGTTSSTGVSSGGVIPANSVGSVWVNGQSNVLGTVVLIMLVMLMLIGVLYMVASVTTLEGLKNTAKAELLEIAGTGIILAVFLGGMYSSIILLATQGSMLQYAIPPESGGTTYAPLTAASASRSVFVANCETLSQSTVGMLYPLTAIGIVNLLLSGLQSLSFKIKTTEGTNFGVEMAPLSGLSFTTNLIGELSGMTSIMIIIALSVLFSMGFIYALFPILLYIGIIFRAFTWTRPLGGTLIALFVGYYLLFPLLLLGTLHGFNSLQVSVAPVGYGSTSTLPSTVSSGFTGDLTGATSQSGALSSMMTFLLTSIGSVFGVTEYGIVNGYIHSFIEPNFFAIFDIILSFIISFDFTDLLADLLGAPSLSSQRLVNRLWLTR